jgi:hypothetical protein
MSEASTCSGVRPPSGELAPPVEPLLVEPPVIWPSQALRPHSAALIASPAARRKPTLTRDVEPTANAPLLASRGVSGMTNLLDQRTKVKSPTGLAEAARVEPPSCLA